MAKRRVRSPGSSCTVVVSDDTDGIFSVDVEVKVAGLNLRELSSDGKLFKVNGREQPMSRFGSWVFQDGSEDQTRKFCIDGGIIASLTWGLQLICPQVEVWVKDISRYSFSLQMKNREKRAVLDKISKGVVARDLENVMRKKIPSIYGNIIIKLIKIVDRAKKTVKSNGKCSDGDFYSRITMLRDLESLSAIMHAENYGLAYTRLKQMIGRDMTGTERIQVLIRLGICCFELNKLKEIQDIVVRVQSITDNMTSDAPPMDMFFDDVARFSQKLHDAEMFTSAVIVMLGCIKIYHEIGEPDTRVDVIRSNVMMCGSLLRLALQRRPMMGVKLEIRKYVHRLEKEVELIRNVKDCNPLLQARAIYYSLYTVNGIKRELGDPHLENMSMLAEMQFSCAESSWADITNVLELGERSDDIASMFRDTSLMNVIKEISANPIVLEKRIMDPRIAKINRILNHDLAKATPMTGFTRIGIGKCDFDMMEEILMRGFGHCGACERSEESQREKEKGNEAYKRRQYDTALQHYERAIQLDPSDALLHSNKAAVFITKDQLDKAKQCCVTAMQIVQANGDTDEQDVAKIVARMARVEFLSKRYDAALTLYRKSLRLNDDKKVRKQMTECEEVVTRNLRLGDFML